MPIAVAVGFLSGLHAATWGMFKDAPHEGFSWPRYFRSAMVGALAALIASVVMRPDFAVPGQVVLFFGLTYTIERGAVEFWKTFLRTEDQTKYFIPMQFAVFGRIVHGRGRRLAIGTVVAAIVVGLFLAIGAWTRGSGMPRSLAFVVLVGSVGGWVSAFLGAWKDAPIEGFETFKFFRSPIVAGTYALLLSPFTENLMLLAIAALGYTVATLETYKTFFFPSKPRGKFANKPIRFPDMLERRKPFAVLYACLWALILTGFALARIFSSRAF
jgi:hypothetical protein